ncbi:MAG: 4-(cytidine 5'-diphospho)-2-C-methyl-D-erythritol kinase [Bacteroidales bacterium]|nr:4-(cytidine 5'-diphospho)-2-C-methyl-D-erythritol kinase [Bacteroidales bacterium]
MLVFPNAKINLGLNVIARRPDGFHNIETLLYPVGLCDALEAIPATDGVFEFTTTGLPIPGETSANLCVRACELLTPIISNSLSKIQGSRSRIQDPGLLLPPVKIHLHKAIPMGAGLGGGSSDGAFMLKLLNELFRLGFSTGQLQEYARLLGSDCAFFVENKPVIAYERGDRFLSLEEDLPVFSLAIVVPEVHCSTTDAYASIVPTEPSLRIARIFQQPIEFWKGDLINDFERPVLIAHPEIEMIKEKLYDAGAMYSSLSGSGAAVYGIFRYKPLLSGLFPGCFVWISAENNF